VLTVANWYVGTANKIEEIRLADGTLIGAGAAPLSIVQLPGTLGRAQTLAAGTSDSSTQSDAVMSNSAQSLVQAMAQFDAGSGSTEPWVPTERQELRPTMAIPW
jgi:hypothetical protein